MLLTVLRRRLQHSCTVSAKKTLRHTSSNIITIPKTPLKTSSCPANILQREVPEPQGIKCGLYEPRTYEKNKI